MQAIEAESIRIIQYEDKDNLCLLKIKQNGQTFEKKGFYTCHPSVVPKETYDIYFQNVTISHTFVRGVFFEKRKEYFAILKT